MSDNLVKRLREYGDDPQDVSLGEWAEWSHKCADRIEELEAAIRNAITLAEQPHYGDRDTALDHCFDAIDVLRDALTGGHDA